MTGTPLYKLLTQTLTQNRTAGGGDYGNNSPKQHGQTDETALYGPDSRLFSILPIFVISRSCVRVTSVAPNQYNPNLFPIGDGFGLLLLKEKFEDTHFRNGVVKRPESTPRGPRKKQRDE